MLAEILEYLATPCPPWGRSLGYLKESIAISARARRCRAAWREHLENCRAAVLEAARTCPVRGTAVVLGSGAILDIPVEELSAMFGRVVLADLVHPWTARLRVRKLAGVQLDSVDVTGALSDVAAGRMPVPATPDLYRNLAPDLTVSANILSQLALLPVKRLKAAGKHTPEDLAGFAARLQSAHLEWLRGLPGVVCLLTDTSWNDGVREGSLLEGIDLPEPLRAWTWNIAPRPEAYPDRDVSHRAGAFVLSRPS
ncbi:hypothetical protein [Fundidesulfovibrio terrae]|uniref:hypothetical protein n=1 Tax=Fundidesulfovibrio terrae TaxID=2922866 RepID=UPI001FAF5888|nr:hypothetical protein [Fundidesulfovibrio terrae]